jgi:hypothetical protein
MDQVGKGGVGVTGLISFCGKEGGKSIVLFTFINILSFYPRIGYPLMIFFYMTYLCLCISFIFLQYFLFHCYR